MRLVVSIKLTEVSVLDWGRAKNVLIYAFLLLNLVLGYQIWMDARETAGANLDFTSLADNTQKAMEEKGIQVLAPIPTETPKLPKLSYEFLEEGKSSGQVELKSPVDSKLIFSPSELEDMLQGEIPQIGTYRLDQLMAEDGAFVLHPLVDSRWPLFNVSLELFYSDQKITGYHQTPVRITTAEESDQQVLPASKALGTLIENFLPNDAIVKDIQLGYYGQLFNSDIQVAMPAWRFVLESGEVLYVQGISGDVFSPKTDKPGE